MDYKIEIFYIILNICIKPNKMAFISTEMNTMLKTIEVDNDDDDDDSDEECIGCETGVDYLGAHLNQHGRYNNSCCTREAEKERNILYKTST